MLTLILALTSLAVEFMAAAELPGMRYAVAVYWMLVTLYWSGKLTK